MKLEVSSNGHNKKVLFNGKEMGRAFRLETTFDICKHDVAILHLHPEITEIVAEVEELFIICGERKFKVLEVLA